MRSPNLDLDERLGRLSSEKEEVLSKILEHFAHNRVGYIRVPTGWGKTFLAKHLMGGYYDEGKLVLFLVSGNNALLEQTFYLDGEKLFENSWILSSGHKKPDMDEIEAKLNAGEGVAVFASLQTLNSTKNKELRDFLCTSADLVVVDEIHNFIENKGNDLINDINRDARILGMTATPFQGVVGNVKFVDEISEEMHEIYSKTLPQCIIEGDLCELEYAIIESNQNMLEMFHIEKLSDLDKGELYLMRE